MRDRFTNFLPKVGKCFIVTPTYVELFGRKFANDMVSQILLLVVIIEFHVILHYILEVGDASWH